MDPVRKSAYRTCYLISFHKFQIQPIKARHFRWSACHVVHMFSLYFLVSHIVVKYHEYPKFKENCQESCCAKQMLHDATGSKQWLHMLHNLSFLARKKSATNVHTMLILLKFLSTGIMCIFRQIKVQQNLVVKLHQ